MDLICQRLGGSSCHTDGGDGQRYIMETVTAGLALFDFDGDGWTDIYLLNKAPLSDDQASDELADDPPRNALYHNLGDWQFVEVTDHAGVGGAGYGLGVTVADFDNDGFPDLFVNNFGPNVLYRNNGGGTFTDVTTQADVVGGAHVGAGAAFLDADGDGNLDLYVANYLEFAFDQHLTKTIQGVPTYISPKIYPPAQDHRPPKSIVGGATRSTMKRSFTLDWADNGRSIASRSVGTVAGPKSWKTSRSTGGTRSSSPPVKHPARYFLMKSAEGVGSRFRVNSPSAPVALEGLQ